MTPFASPPVVSTATAAVMESLTRGSDDRWTAWQARSAAHDRAERRKLAIVASIVASVAAAILYAFVVR